MMTPKKIIFYLALVFVAGLCIGARTTIFNGILTSDLDANNHKIINLSADQSFPAGTLADGSVTSAKIADGTILNADVSASAAIVQSKISLNGVIPVAWLGSGSTTAAQGNLVELLSHKAQANGYASLDGSGKIPTAQLPASAGVGTVTDFSAGNLSPLFTTTESTTTSTPALTFILSNAAATSWFGNATGSSAAPAYNTTALPDALIPNLNASKTNAGVFATARIPVMVARGGSHAPGAVIDTGTTGADTDYLARDATWKTIPAGGGSDTSYQPVVPTVSISASSNTTGNRTVTLADSLAGVAIFYTLSQAPIGGDIDGPYTPYTSSVTLLPGESIWAYAAKVGYTNSTRSTYTNPNLPP